MCRLCRLCRLCGICRICRICRICKICRICRIGRIGRIWRICRICRICKIWKLCKLCKIYEICKKNPFFLLHEIFSSFSFSILHRLNQNAVKSKVRCPHSISRTCLAQEFGLVTASLMKKMPNSNLHKYIKKKKKTQKKTHLLLFS